MARRKRSVALFEVIQRDKQFGPRGGVLPTPAWWFKNREQVTGNREQEKTPAAPAPLVPPTVPAAGRSLSEAVLSRSVFSPHVTRTSAAIIAGSVVVVALLGFAWV